ncbi:hypothetical protein ACFVU2_19355 [Leifsonia sp. NPDC058194]|uniref:hypothetical protein n=1 Tax=Leifsonia sp. NPDC058194 TaxID=3346374 RepID=UPI0036DECA7F
MTRKAGAPADEYGLRIVERLREAIDRSGRTDKSVYEAARLSSNYFYIRMRGERPFTVNDIGALARVLDLDPLVLFTDEPAARGRVSAEV